MRAIYEYIDYRKYLSDWCTHEREVSDSFSFRNFSRAAGLASPSYLKMVIDGKRNISLDTIPGFAKALKLNAEESRFFENLVHFSQARTHKAKNLYYHRLLRNRRFRDANHLSKERYEYFSKWYYAAIREMVALPGFRDDPSWIAKRLRPQVTKAEAKAALALLLRLGLVVRGKDGKIVLSDASVTTSDEVNSLAVANFHKEMIDRARDSLTQPKGKRRNISSLTIALSKEKFARIKDRIHEFRKEIRAMIGEGDSPDDVYQINFQLFCLTEVEDEA
jgi:uncharacterized protein (TIGR02147 family)